MSGASVASSLDALLSVLQPSRLPPGSALLQASSAFTTAVKEAEATVAGWGDEEKSLLARKLAMLGPRLAALNARVRPLLGRGSAADAKSVVVCVQAGLSALAMASSLIASKPMVDGTVANFQAWQGLLEAAPLLTGAGCQLLLLARGGGRLGPLQLPAVLVLTLNLLAGRELLETLPMAASLGTSPPSTRQAVAAAAAAAFPYSDTVRWLGALACALLEEVVQRGQEGLQPRDLLSFAVVCECLLASDIPALEGMRAPVQAAVQADSALQRQLVQLLRYCLRAAAPPLERLQGEGYKGRDAQAWQFLVSTGAALFRPCLGTAATQQLQQDQAGTQQLGATLARQLPLGWPEDPEMNPAYQHAWVAAGKLLAMSLSSEQAPHSQQQSARREVLELAPRLCAALKALLAASPTAGEAGGSSRSGSSSSASMPPTDVSQVLCAVWHVLLICPFQPVRPLGQGASFEDEFAANGQPLGLLLEAADALLRLLPSLLPHMASIVQTASALAEDIVTVARTALGYAVCVRIEQAVSAVLAQGQPQPQASSQPGEPANDSDAAAAAQRLHPTACRLVHWCASLPPAAQQRILGLTSVAPRLVLSLPWLAFTLTSLANTQPPFMSQGQASSTTNQHAAASRRLAAVSAAHWEAMQVIAGKLGGHPGLAARDIAATRVWAEQLAGVAAHLPAALLSPHLLREVHLQAVQAAQSPQLPADIRMGVVAQLAYAAASSPRFCLLLLLGGVMESLLHLLPPLVARYEAAEQALRADANLRQAMSCLGSEASRIADEELLPSGRTGGGASGGMALGQQLRAAAGQLQALLPAQDSAGLGVLTWDASRGDRILQAALAVARLLQQHWGRPEQAAADRLELARAAAMRSCAFLRCADLGREGGAGPGQGAGSKRCSLCHTAWYCSTACSHADWRGPGGQQHSKVCRALAAVRQG